MWKDNSSRDQAFRVTKHYTHDLDLRDALIGLLMGRLYQWELGAGAGWRKILGEQEEARRHKRTGLR